MSTSSATSGPSPKRHPKLQEHFYNMDQQLEASTLGMWVFLVTEVMFFGGMFMAYIVYRNMYPHAWIEASHELDWRLGWLNTSVLIVSSLTMALAVRAAMLGIKKQQVLLLLTTMSLGMVFLIVKFFEYKAKFAHHLVPGPHFDPTLEQGMQIFFSLYFMLTGVHAAHMIIGLGIMTYITINAAKGTYNAEYYGPVEVAGLYWHFVDIVWIFLFPLLYLLGRHVGAGA
jgi:cytochrome c oxidase subunit 3